MQLTDHVSLTTAIWLLRPQTHNTDCRAFCLTHRQACHDWPALEFLKQSTSWRIAGNEGHFCRIWLLLLDPLRSRLGIWLLSTSLLQSLSCETASSGLRLFPQQLHTRPTLWPSQWHNRRDESRWFWGTLRRRACGKQSMNKWSLMNWMIPWLVLCGISNINCWALATCK